MATQDAKVKRRAEALNKLNRLSQLLADNMDIEVPDVRPTNRDPELAQIQQVEAINELLQKVLTASGVDTEPAAESEAPKLEGMTKAELLKLANERGLQVAKSAKKNEIIEALNA